MIGVRMKHDFGPVGMPALTGDEVVFTMGAKPDKNWVEAPPVQQ